MTRRIVIIIFAGLLWSPVNAQRVKYNFNCGWKVFAGDDADAKGTLSIIEVEIYEETRSKK